MTRKYPYRLFLIFVILVTSFILTAPVFAQTPTPQPNNANIPGDKVVIGNTYRLQSGETLQGDLAIIGGTATIESGATVDGDLVLIGGTITNNGTVNGNLVAVGGVATLGDRSILNGDIVTVGASLKRAATAEVTGKISEQTPSINFGEGGGWQFPWRSSQTILSKLLAAAFESLALAALAVIIGLILPEPTRRIAEAIHNEPVVTGAVGLLAIIGTPVLLAILVITLILIPVAVLALIALGVAILFGWIGLGYEFGERLGKLFHTDWSVPVAGGIGVLILSLLVGTINLIPCVGWLIGFVFSLLGLGAIVTTRFGTINSTPTKPVTISIPPSPPNSQQPPQPPSINE